MKIGAKTDIDRNITLLTQNYADTQFFSGSRSTALACTLIQCPRSLVLDHHTNYPMDKASLKYSTTTIQPLTIIFVSEEQYRTKAGIEQI